MRPVFNYFGEMLPFMLGAAPFVAAFLLIKAKKQKPASNARRLVGRGIFLVFLAGLLSLSALPLNGELQLGEPYFRLRGSFNLRLFRFVGETIAAARAGDYNLLILNVFGNLIMFMPVGFFAGLLWEPRGFWRAARLSLGISLFIEISQLFQFRATDIDDVILNVLGGVLGYCVYLIIRKLAPRFCAKFKQKTWLNCV